MRAGEERAPSAEETTWGPGIRGRLVYAIAVAFSAFQIWTATYGLLPSQIVRSVHVGFLLLLTFALLANRSSRNGAGVLSGWVLGLSGFVLGLYHWVFYRELILRAGEPELQDIVVGVVVVALVFEAARRLMGPALPIICALFLAYALFGHLLPAPLGHRGYDLGQVVDQMFLGTEGIYGVPTYVSSTYIFLFILFGAFLERAGMIRLFNDVALGTVGHTRGGPAKVAVVSSALMGTINGSGVANVVTTGQFTIPLMKRFGYPARFAGAVEATASMGGQIMPPVMGAVAFIMAETLGVPYVEICIAAAIPALLYFLTAFLTVHFEAGKRRLVGLPRTECPSALAALRRDWYLLLPLVALVWLLFSGYTPLFAGSIGLGLTALVVLGRPLAAVLPFTASRVVFWVVLGLAAASFLRLGPNALLATIGLLVLGCLFVRGGRETLRLARDSLADGARNALPVGIACALVGTIIGTLTLTGAATTFAGAVVDIGKESLFFSLFLTMLTCLVLGTGIPTIPNYIITSAIAGPALLELGVPLIVSHMFVFYFGIMADLTPPVALAALAASPIAGASHLAIGVTATRIAIAGYVVPFMAVYSPSLLLQPGDPMAEVLGFWPAVLYVVAKAVLGVTLWAAATTGFLKVPLSWPERIWCLGAAGLLVVALPVTDELGLGAAAAFFLFHLGWRARAVRAAAAAVR
ncbi:MAG: TRAP transporter permease [Geminicoccaceae bacterium]|nr:TRAP transporter permease [Geminicoccaceae bacterium]